MSALLVRLWTLVQQWRLPAYVGPWKVERFCAHCAEPLTWEEVYYCRCCVHCGAIPKGTIVDHEKRVCRWRRDEPGGPERVEWRTP